MSSLFYLLGKKKVNYQHYWEIQTNENPLSFANQNFHFLSFGSSRCRIANAFIPCGSLIWSEVRKLKSQPMCTCQSIVCSYGKLFRLSNDKSEPILSGLFKEERDWMAIRNHLVLTRTFKCYLDRTQSHIGWGNIYFVNLFIITSLFHFILDSFIQSKHQDNFSACRVKNWARVLIVIVVGSVFYTVKMNYSLSHS